MRKRNISGGKSRPGAGRGLVWLLLIWPVTSLPLIAQNQPTNPPITDQTPVTFSLDLEPLLEEQLFVPARGDRVFVAGEFNGWNSAGSELLPGRDSTRYAATFVLDGAPGDTLAYKYVIARGGDRYFWEIKPDPSNPPDGNRTLQLTGDSLALPPVRFCFDEYFSFPVTFSRNKLVTDFDTIRAMLERIHPALYDYTGKPGMDSAFDHARDQLQEGMTFREYYTLLSGVMARIGCGHSSLWIQGDYWKSAPDALFPLKLYLAPGGAWVRGHYGDTAEVAPGSRILSINGVPMEQVVSRLEGFTSADGFNASYKRHMVGKNFSRKYALAYGFPGEFRIIVQDPGSDHVREVSLEGVPASEIDRQAATSGEMSFRFLEGGRVGVLTIPTFGYYDRVDEFHAFMDSVFREIGKHGTGHLIMDLRGNSGGDPFCAAYLFSYLEHAPSPYFEEHYGRYDTLALPLPQPAGHFKGKLYTLIDGGGFSTTGHFCALLKYHGIGTFIGEETGATYTCTGSAMYPTMEQTRIILGTARNRRYTAAVKGMDPRRGILPDHPVFLSPEDLVTGRDAVLDFALSLAE